MGLALTWRRGSAAAQGALWIAPITPIFILLLPLLQFYLSSHTTLSFVSLKVTLKTEDKNQTYLIDRTRAIRGLILLFIIQK